MTSITFKLSLVALFSLVLLGSGCVPTNEPEPVGLPEPTIETVQTEPTQNEPELHYTNASADDIVVDLASLSQPISSPLTVTGKARGTWFFEGSAPITLVNWDGLIIAEGFITAEGEWMTEDFVPFSGTLEFETPELYDRGGLILRNDNPSGLPENDKAVEISLNFVN